MAEKEIGGFCNEKPYCHLWVYKRAIVITVGIYAGWVLL
jgi:hypothetical protein